MTEKQHDIEDLHWNEVEGNPYLQNLHPLMMTDDGYKALRQTRHKSVSRSFACKVPYAIHYDQSYVTQWIVRRLISRLAFKDYREFNSLMSECWKAYQEMNGQKSRKRRSSKVLRKNEDQASERE